MRCRECNREIREDERGQTTAFYYIGEERAEFVCVQCAPTLLDDVTAACDAMRNFKLERE